jgi:hypothetical protein
MHEKDEEAINQIDAMIFSGDTMSDNVIRTNFRNMIKRWEKELNHWDELEINYIKLKLRWFETKYGGPYDGELKELKERND